MEEENKQVYELAQSMGLEIEYRYLGLKFYLDGDNKLQKDGKNISKHELDNYNNDGRNIYIALNTFMYKRTRKEEFLFEFRYFGIDLDINMELNDLLNLIDNKIGVRPYKINKTFKGYHIFFKLDEELYFIDKQSYNSIIIDWVEKVGGDTQNRTVTDVLKCEGYYDRKPGRNDFMIKTVYFDEKAVVKLNDLVKLGYNVKFGHKKILKKLQLIAEKEKNRVRNKKDIEEIDGLCLIEKINENYGNPYFDKKIILHKGGGNYYRIDDTSGLTVHLKYGHRVIGDFTEKSRYGNWKFLVNYYFKEYLENEKNIEPVFREIYKLLGKNFSIKPKINSEMQRILPKSVLYNIENNNYKMSETIDQDVINGFNDLLIGTNKGECFKYYISLLFYIDKFHKFSYKYGTDILIGETDFLDFLGYTYKYTNKLNTRFNFKLLSNLEILKSYNETINGITGIVTSYEKLMIFESFKDKSTGKEYYKIRLNNIFFKNYLRLNEKVITLQSNYFRPLLQILNGIDSYKGFKMSLHKINDYLGAKDTKNRSLYRFLGKIFEIGLIKYYSVENKYVIFY